MSRIFINYRREDSAPYAGRLYDRLTARFGKDQVFMDIDQIEPGEDFVEVINHKVGACETAVVLIGKAWLSATDGEGRRRLDDPEDFVRLEVAAALQRNVRVVPVLVGGAAMPRMQQLPQPLALLSRRNAIEITDSRFHRDVDRLIEALEKTGAAALDKQARPEPRVEKEDETPQQRPTSPDPRTTESAATSAAALSNASSGMAEERSRESAPDRPYASKPMKPPGNQTTRNRAAVGVAVVSFVLVVAALSGLFSQPSTDVAVNAGTPTSTLSQSAQSATIAATSTDSPTAPAPAAGLGDKAAATTSGFNPFAGGPAQGRLTPGELQRMDNDFAAELARADLQALEETRRRAAGGSAEAQYHLAAKSECGEEKNPQEALRWYKLAAAQGHKPAQEALVALQRAEPTEFQRTLRDMKCLSWLQQESSKKLNEMDKKARDAIRHIKAG